MRGVVGGQGVHSVRAPRLERVEDAVRVLLAVTARVHGLRPRLRRRGEVVLRQQNHAHAGREGRGLVQRGHDVDDVDGLVVHRVQRVVLVHARAVVHHDELDVQVRGGELL